MEAAVRVLQSSLCVLLSALGLIHYHCPCFMQDFYLLYQNSQFYGARAGTGSQLLICLHGFGESSAHFQPLISSLGDVFTIIALDMPWHGRTNWQEEKPFKKEDLVTLLQQLLQQEGKDRFSLLGYSMGGRLSLCLVEEMAGQIDHLIMAAGDGLKNNGWQLFVTRTSIGNKIFKYNIYHPQLFFCLLRTWYSWGILNYSIYKFVLHRMDSLQKREFVYKVWTGMRFMHPNKKRCKQLLAENNVPTLLIFGKHDRIIPPVLGRSFANKSFSCKILVLNRGHQLISPQLGFIIKSNI